LLEGEEKGKTIMADLQKKSFHTPDEKRTPPKATMEIVSFNGMSVVRATYAEGWRWSEHTRPVVGTQSCQVPHLAYVISGRIAVQMTNGPEIDFGPGDLIIAPPGHDGWVIGDEPCVVLDFAGASRAV
jgi:quercetin dioxygenase-like cupin family protein